MAEPRTLPDDARLLHIGFRKCGTTALQSTLRSTRRQLRELGVVYPGTGLNHTGAALGITGQRNGWASLGAKPQSREKWDLLVDEVAGLGPHQRAVIDSEFFDIAPAATIRSIVDGLGGDRVHVLVTVRPLHKILPSSWQQNVQFGVRRSYEEWLRVVLDGDDTMRTHRGFWQRHGHADVLSRWSEVVGPGHVTLVVLDESDRLLPFRSVEAMLGLPTGTLKEIPGRANRSMTVAEAELVRRINVELFSHDISWDEYTYWIRRGAAHDMWWKRTPEPGEARIRTPQWALARVAELAADLPSRIAGLGIEVVGDLGSLAPPQPPPATGDPDEEPAVVPIDAAVQAVVGACLSSRYIPAKPVTPAAKAGNDVLSGRQLARAVAVTVRHQVRRLRSRNR